MQLKTLSLENFRIFAHKKIDFDFPLTLLIAKNGAGKTSILEAIVLGSLAKSFRAGKIEEMIKFEADYSRVVLELGSELSQDLAAKNSSKNRDFDLAGLDEVKLEIMITPGQIQGRRTAKQLYRVNDLKRSKRKFLGHFYSVIFRPEDMKLIEGSPGRRRTFLDNIFVQFDADYARALTTYEQALKRRNKLLFKIREGEADKQVLTYWNLTMLKHGKVLQEKRQDFFEFSKSVDFPVDFIGEYQPSVISQSSLASHQQRAIAAGHSLIGPQKDDFIVRFVQLENRDVAVFGSRGQQRMTVLWLKICALHFLQKHTKVKPALLLDDIFSELDADSRGLILPLFKKYQTIITSTNEQVGKLLSEQKIGFKKMEL